MELEKIMEGEEQADTGQNIKIQEPWKVVLLAQD